MANSNNYITKMLISYSNGDFEALDKIMPLIYDELKKLASYYLRNQNALNTIKTTDLVHEVYLKLIDQNEVNWQNRAHFFGVAATAMRHILIDYARKRNAVKRGNNPIQVTLDSFMTIVDERVDEWIKIDDALKRLETIDDKQSKIVELRYFTGLTIQETAVALGISPATVKREWTMAKAWLARELME